MNPIILFLREDIMSEDKSEVNKVRKPPHFWLSEDQKLYKRFFLGQIYSTFTPRLQSYSLRSYMKGFVEAIQEEDLCLTELRSEERRVGKEC